MTLSVELNSGFLELQTTHRTTYSQYLVAKKGFSDGFSDKRLHRVCVRSASVLTLTCYLKAPDALAFRERGDYAQLPECSTTPLFDHDN